MSRGILIFLYLSFAACLCYGFTGVVTGAYIKDAIIMLLGCIFLLLALVFWLAADILEMKQP